MTFTMIVSFLITFFVFWFWGTVISGSIRKKERGEIGIISSKDASNSFIYALVISFFVWLVWMYLYPELFSDGKGII